MSKSRRAALSAAACSLALVASGASTLAHAESLADAIALAYQTNPTLQAQRANQRVLDEGVVQARAGLRPTISASATAAITNNDAKSVVGTNADRNTSTGALSVSQPLFTGGRVASQVDAAASDIASGRESLRRVEASVLLSVIQAYVDVRRGEEAVRISTENVAVLNRQREEAQARFDVGEITRTNVAQAEARLAAAQATLSSTRAALGISRAAYAAVVGQNPSSLEAEPSLAAFMPANVDDAFSAAEQASPQVLAAIRAEEASRSRVSAARAGRRPVISANASLGYSGAQVNGVGSQFSDYDRALSTGLTASVPLFTGGLTSSQVRVAIERNNADRIAVESARRAVLQSVSQAWNQLLGARANLVSNQEQVRATTVAFEGVRAENQVGLRTTLDVLNAEQELRSAQLALITARRDEYVASATLLAAMGRLEAKNLAPNAPQYDATANTRAVSHALGWVPWEPVLEIIDRVGGPFPRPAPETVPVAHSTPQ